MDIDGKTYTLAQLKEKMPRYQVFFYEKITEDSQEAKLDRDPIATTNPNLHMRYDASKVLIRGDKEIADRKYTFLGLVGTRIYSSVRKYFHDEDNVDNKTQGEIP